MVIFIVYKINLIIFSKHIFKGKFPYLKDLDFVNPLIVAEKIALTEEYRFVSSTDISKEIKEGARGVSGIGARGKSKIIG